MLQKIYGAPSDAEARRYSPAKCIGSDMKVVSGDPDPKHVSTSYVERHNLTMRMGMRRFTRLTNEFSKKFENHAAMVAIHAVYYNFARIHKTLRIISAMTASLSDHVWSLEEIVLRADNYMPKPSKRGTYKKRAAKNESDLRCWIRIDRAGLNYLGSALVDPLQRLDYSPA